jgi:hypothetical protein
MTLVERLRRKAKEEADGGPEGIEIYPFLEDEAADRIESLEAALREAKEEFQMIATLTVEVGGRLVDPSNWMRDRAEKARDKLTAALEPKPAADPSQS